MARVRSSLTLDAAVPIDMAPTTTLGRDASLIGTIRVGAGLGPVVAGTAPDRGCYLVLPVPEGLVGSPNQTLEMNIVCAFVAEHDIAAFATQH